MAAMRSAMISPGKIPSQLLWHMQFASQLASDYQIHQMLMLSLLGMASSIDVDSWHLRYRLRT